MAITGYCIINIDMDSESTSDNYTIITTGSVQTNKNNDHGARLLEIHNDINWIINKYNPDVAAIEEIFFFKNAKSIMSVCESRGVIMMTLKMNNVPVYEYTPLVVKQTITGYGRADKNDVKQMIQIMFTDKILPKLDDTVDAIAIAICHSRHNDCRICN